MKDKPTLILASGSPRRRQLLKQAGIPFRVMVSHYHEGKPQGDPGVFVRLAAMAKAREVARRVSHPAWILAADTLVVQGGKIFGKPESRTQAGRMLRMLSGKEHTVMTGVVFLHSVIGKQKIWLETTRVGMRKIPEHEMKAYLATRDWEDKAGAYGIQSIAGAFVRRVDGCYYNIVGLPLAGVTHFLDQVGIHLCSAK
ncbi:Maf family protein [bacterium]|nr:Maf family protein [bacterium]